MPISPPLQLPSSPHSLSEPPDIKNWCPSYEYESFVLDTYDDDLKGCGFGESGSELNWCGVAAKDRIGREEGDLGESLQQEPSHIRNWFPSYLYKSPSLNSIDDYKETDVNKTNCEEETKGETEERIWDQRTSGNNNEVSASLHLDSLVAEESLFGDACKSKPFDKTSETYQSLLSEPPDLRNWFSSYVYESPEVGETECQEEDLLKDVSILSTTVLKHDEEDSQPIHEGNGVVRKVIISGGINSCKQNGMHQTQSSLNKEACLASIKSNKKTNVINSKPPKVFTHGNDLGEDLEDGGVKAETHDLGSPEEALKKMDDKENQGKLGTSDGFVSIRKSSRSISENSPREVLQSNRKSMLNGASKRQALSERTNLECYETTGKWHCPLKNKPIVGPPLKQLRLERWVHRT